MQPGTRICVGIDHLIFCSRHVINGEKKPLYRSLFYFVKWHSCQQIFILHIFISIVARFACSQPPFWTKTRQYLYWSVRVEVTRDTRALFWSDRPRPRPPPSNRESTFPNLVMFCPVTPPSPRGDSSKRRKGGRGRGCGHGQNTRQAPFWWRHVATVVNTHKDTK